MSARPKEVKKQLAKELLAAGKTSKEVARELGLGQTTVWLWRQNPEFQAEVDALVSQSLAEIRQHRINAHKILGTAAERAALVLMELLDSENDFIRLHAARLILDKIAVPEPSPEQEKIEAGKPSFQEVFRGIVKDVYGITIDSPAKEIGE